MTSDIRREAEELVRYYAELGRRLAQAGVRDVADLLEMYEHLQRAVAAVSAQEIGWASDQVQALVQRLVRMDSNLQGLRRLKIELGDEPEPATGRAGSMGH